MEEPLIPQPRTTRPGRSLFIWFKFLFALLQLVPGVGLCMYLGLFPDIDASYRTWFAFCTAILVFTGSMQLIAISLYALQAKKAAYLWAGLGSQWVNCMAPLPIVVLLVFGTQLPEGKQGERGLALGVMVLAGFVLALNVLCEWKKACFVCISCCGICDSKREAGAVPSQNQP